MKAARCLACLIPLKKGHCVSKTETNGLSFSTSQLSKVMALGLQIVFFLSDAVSLFNKVLKKREGGMGAGDTIPFPQCCPHMWY
jgi:hypothetical protein